MSEMRLTKLKNWNIKVLSKDDIEEMQKFIQLFEDFFALCEGGKGSALGILSACPSTKNISKDKFVLGIYEHKTLIGLLDIVRNYPRQDVWTIGYLLIHPNYRNRGIGSQFIDDIQHALHKITLRCIVQEQNLRALSFWQSNQFTVVGQVEDKLGCLINKAYILEKILTS